MDDTSTMASFNITAENGGTAIAPSIANSSINSVNINYTNSSGGGTSRVDSGKGDYILEEVLDEHKSRLRRRFQGVFEGNNQEKTSLNQIYTELHIIKGESKTVNEEHEIPGLDAAFKARCVPETTINCNDIFEPLQDMHIRVVLTRGIAGIGKTVAVHKFILDWAGGQSNQDIKFVIVLPFQELNSVKGKTSLQKLAVGFHPELKKLGGGGVLEDHKTLFIFDGLDESTAQMDFTNSELVFDVTAEASVDVLLTNLVKGHLLSSALVWMTSRSRPTGQMALRWFNRVTEVRGFTQSQKEKYFRAKITNPAQADRIISHVKVSRSLQIMCHIPVFCWITASVLQDFDLESKPPKTLTEIYIHFLLIQKIIQEHKYHRIKEKKQKTMAQPEDHGILNLAKLAFSQLMKSEGAVSRVFYEGDLKTFGIEDFESLTPLLGSHASYGSGGLPLDGLLKNAVDAAMKSKNGHLDLFLRFLLGISVKSNQDLLKGILSGVPSSSDAIERTTKYMRELRGDSFPPERFINLFHGLFELNDHSMQEEMKEYLASQDKAKEPLSPSQCSALAYVLLMSDETLDELDLEKYNMSDEGSRRLVPVVRSCRKAMLVSCNLDTGSYEIVASALQCPGSHLKELDMSCNNLQDSNVTLLSKAMSSPHCKLESLRLYRCGLTEKSCEALASVFESANTQLKKLDLSDNSIQDSGVNRLFSGMTSPHCNLEDLRLARCGLTEKSCLGVTSVLQHENSCLKKLDLSDNDLKDSGVEALAAGLTSSQSKLQSLSLSGCLISEKGCQCLASALGPKPSCLKELDLSYNHPGDAGMRLISALPLKANLSNGAKCRLTSGLKKRECC
ncbi:NLR family CARD domain-containing protein 3-like isoform X2 [Denticeps clupeoides]|uniref:NLR family CARD domain-containing protein 3-like isoform X2 n=1 Tax=Denticeps clupeoides TaxID=299321 RepID=UPI0010A53074|nr:NLR family CARD domain-containing protein 3-like isoform X2 [Denticeps clupeoides]